MDSDITIGAGAYRIGRMDAWRQFHVVRRLTPLLTAMAKAAREAHVPVTAKPDDAASEQMLEGLVAMSGVLSTMDDKDCDYVIRACLSVCQKRQGDLWLPMLSATGQLMYGADTTLADLLKITSAVLQHQEGLADFFQNPLSHVDLPRAGAATASIN